MERQGTKPRKNSLRSRFIILYLALVLLPVLALSFLFMGTSLGYMKNMVGYSEQASFEQTGQLLEYYVSNVNDNANFLLGQDEFHKIIEKDNSGESAQDQIKDMLLMRKLLNTCRNKAEVTDVYLYVDNSALYIGEASQMRNLSEVAEKPWYQYVETGYPNSIIIPSDSVGKESVVGYAKSIHSERNYNKIVGMIFFELNKSVLTSYLGGTETTEAFIVNKRGERIAESREGCTDIALSELVKYADGKSHMVAVGKESYFLYTKLLEGTEWYLVYLEPSSILWEMFRQQGIQYLMVFLLILTMGLAFFWFFFRFCFNRIAALTDHMSKIQEALPPPVEEGTRGDEIDELIAAYNYMLGKVEGLMRDQYELGNQIKEIEMKALYEQINPHFLYNTLTMINWLAEDGQTEDVSRVITALSSFYRLSLNKGSENISLAEELLIAENFVYIQQMRFGTDIRLENRVDPVYESFVLPKLTLQPLVENALVHGILKRRDKCGTITVSVSEREGMLLISVSDNGIGMDQETVEKMNAGTIRSGGKHYGVWNVVQRASLYFGAPCTLSCTSREGEGTTIVLALPYREKR